MSQHHVKIKNDPRWKQARADCLARDGHACLWCEETEGLEADHITRLADAPELAFDLDNLQTLCTDCHDQKERDYQANKSERKEFIHSNYRELMNEEKEFEEMTKLFL